MPHKSTLKAERHQLACAGPANKRAIKRIWLEDRRAFFKHRKRMLWIKRVTPYWGCTPNGGCHWWALPAYIPACESGGDYHVGFAGAYGLLTATWHQWGGSALVGTNDAGEAPPWAQDLIAHKVWVDVGPGGWECA